MAIRLSGLTSGMDTEAIVTALVSAQKTKTTKVQNKLTKSEWTKEAWTDLNKKIYSLYTTELSKFKTQGNYKSKKVSSSNDMMATATATSSAANGSHTLKINKLASSQSVTSGEINATDANAKLVDIGVKKGTVITITGEGNKTKEIEVTDSTTINDFVSGCKTVGLNASYDKNQKRLFISSSKSGTDSGFSITTQTGNYDVAKTKLDDMIAKASENAFDKDLQAIKDADISKLKSLVGMSGGAALTDADDELIKAYQNLDSAMGGSKLDGLIQDYATQKEAEKNGTTADVEAAWKGLETEANTVKDSIVYTDISTKLAQDIETLKGVSAEQMKVLRGETLKDEDGNEYTVEVSQDLKNTFDSAKSMVADAKEFEKVMQQYASSKDFVATNGSESTLSALGLQEISKDLASGKHGEMSVIQATDAEIELDGATLTGKTNEFTVNGLTINLKNVTPAGQSITLNTTTDVDAVYNMVKDFVKKYNEVLDEMNEKYNATSAKGYDPLTDDEKAAMTDDQIEKWEKKIKDSLLRRDNTLDGVITAMRSSLLTTSKIDGKAYSLASFGIQTSSDYTEKGKLHIFGDEEDETYSDKTNKLKEAIENNPDAVMKTLADAGQALYEALTKKMERTSLSSALTFYNDKKMDTEQATYKKQIKELEEKLSDMEDRYYKRFTAMEKAMADMQSQTNALGSMMGYSAQ